jgi:peptidyl-prolyl cis-trans isomerase SurA
MKIARSIQTACLIVLGSAAVLGGQVIEQVLVKVNGEIFTKTELETLQITSLRQLDLKLDSTNDPTGAELRKALDRVTPEIMVNAVDQMLIVQHGRDLGYRLSDEQFQRALDGIKKDNKLESEDDLKAALKQENMTLADLRRNLERTIIVQQVQQNEVLGRIAISDEESKRYYDAHVTEFTTPAAVTLREIFVNVPGDGTTLNVGLDEEAREKANGIRERAVAGESFEKLAADLSDAASRANAGLIGPLGVDELAPDLRKLVEGMKVGEVTTVMRAARGYQILKLESMTTPTIMPFDAAKERISQRVFTDKRLAEFQKFIERLRAQAIIEWKNAEVRKAYDLGVEQQKANAGRAS